MRIKRTLPALALGLLLVAGCGQATDSDTAPPTPTGGEATVAPTLASPEEQTSEAQESPSAAESIQESTEPPAPAGESPSAPVTEDPSTMGPVEGEWMPLDVEVKSADDLDAIADLPEDFRAFVASIAGVTDSYGCTIELTITGFHPAGFASGAEFAPGCGGSMAVWSKAGGSWATVLEMQAVLDCAEFENNFVPKGSPDLTCLDASGEVVAW